MKFAYGLDIETHDPLLKTSGYSWKYGRGYILNTAVYDATHDSVIVLAGIHNENCPYKAAQRREQNEVVKKILTNPDAIVVGANIIYDLGWLLYEYGMEGSDVKCSLVDVLQAEHILDEFTTCSLESVSRKYLHYGKSKDGAERWVREHLHGAGDFRRHLNAVPWDLLCEYVSGDAKNPVKVWLKQVALLRKQNLLERAKLEFNCILPTLQLTALGMPIDAKQKRANLDTLDEAIYALEREFKERYGMPNFRVTASADIAKFCDMRGIPYNHKITLTGERGERFSTDARMRAACQRARRLVSSMHIEKNRAVAYVPKELAERTGLLLADAGFDFNSSPNVDKNFFAGSREAHPEIDLIANWKLALGLKSKILGPKFDQFITKNAEGLDCVRSQYPITSTVTFRFCSEKANLQQVPSKGGFTAKGVEYSFPKLTRSLFTAAPGCVFGKIDYGQIEYRLICNIAVGAEGERVRAMYMANPHIDFHQMTMDFTGLVRKLVKSLSFGTAFGMSIESMAKMFGWSLEHAKEIYATYNEKMPFVKPTLEAVGLVAQKRGYIITALGSHARLQDKSRAYTMLNRYTQGSGAECFKAAMVRAFQEGVWQKIKAANIVHDELNAPYLRPKEEDMLAFYRMAEIMRTAVPSLKVPLEAEIELGDNWADTREVKDWISEREAGSEAWARASYPLKSSVAICERLIKEGRVQSA